MVFIWNVCQSTAATSAFAQWRPSVPAATFAAPCLNLGKIPGAQLSRANASKSFELSHRTGFPAVAQRHSSLCQEKRAFGGHTYIVSTATGRARSTREGRRSQHGIGVLASATFGASRDQI
ncbi:hypothetical protein F4677DRAFT_439702 [Hypoxylon crocopeplum]|nr:hypothetical protein F4677DRAFT_439702 [Hypoxylon crocopeplum]